MKYNTIETARLLTSPIPLRRESGVNVPLLLKKLKNYLGINTNIELSRILDVKPNTISTWKRRNSLDYELIISICNMMDIDLNVLFAMDKDKQQATSSILAIPIEAQYQYVSGYSRQEFLDKMPKCKLPFSFSNTTTRAFQMAGISMSPTLKEGAYVLAEKITSPEEITNNMICILISKLRGIHINRVRRDAGTSSILNLLNDNPTFPGNIVMPLEEITEAWKVTGSLALNLIKAENDK
ncbi:helix-turn-helix domain-containing protein [Sinomicrobium soli]|uniref:helix-turn-helix domain-containing protein n=1 Tax=Sinomicrobium sp. N-1-3-6 TaxID=2219864 RepID=UPI000DCF5EF2|nr:helix-turn-helix domain-containing protein [Sinomicrobium sp. N-1-3-6]RAV29676.1 hypothetical protein DN748_06035 [Sinomicrobium sp. N-1-3-6]